MTCDNRKHSSKMLSFARRVNESICEVIRSFTRFLLKLTQLFSRGKSDLADKHIINGRSIKTESNSDNRLSLMFHRAFVAELYYVILRCAFGMRFILSIGDGIFIARCKERA